MSPEELVETNIGLAQKAAGSGRVRGLDDYDDVYSDALLGLWDAARRYDESRGARFATFAWPRMIGAIADGRRERDYIPRSMRAKGGAPPPISLETITVQNDRGGALTLADTLADPRDYLAEVDDAADAWAEHVRLYTTIAALPPDDRYVLRRLLDGITLAEIGVEMGFSESRACQISGRAVRRLRAALWDDPEAA